MHRHFGYKGRKFAREAGPRKALVRNLVSQLILHEEITTTLEKAKEIRPVVERLITRAKKGTLADRRIAGEFLSNKDKSLEKLFVELGPLYQERKGGYTRILKLENRLGDNAKMARIMLLDTEKLTKKAMSKETEKKETPVKKETKNTASTPKAKSPKKATPKGTK